MKFTFESNYTGEPRLNNFRVKKEKKHICFLGKVLYHENSKMRFLWHRDNVKIDHISRSRYI